MKILFKILAIFIFFWINISFAAINMTVSPIKYELSWKEWTTITKKATLHNRGNTDIQIVTWKSDFISSWTNWSPSFVRYSELVHPDQQLSSWISLSSNWFTVPAKSKKEIEFTITIPQNATPGWHYWAVFFKNNNSETTNSNWNAVWINVDYWIIILLKVEWEIITDVIIDNDNISIDNNSWKNSSSKWWYSKSSKNNYNLWKVWTWENITKKDNCLLDFTNSRFDWKCFDEPNEIIKIVKWEENKAVDKNKENIADKKTDKNTEKNKEKQSENFNISFKIPVDNKWNTHIKATWEIKLFDEDWNQIKQIGKKVIVNKKGAIVWEKIVDYLPINDNKGNVLPWTKRIFEPEWKWFPFKHRDNEWNIVIDYKNPWEYYSDESANKDVRLFPWERICYDKKTKKITAKFDVAYIDEQWKEVSFPSAKEFEVTYTRKYIWYNYYLIFSVIAILIFLFIFFWIIWLIRNKKCINKDCKKKIKRKLKICPYCETIQNKTEKNKKNIAKKTITKKEDSKKKVIKKTKKKIVDKEKVKTKKVSKKKTEKK